MGLVCLYLEMSKNFTTSMKILSMSKTSSLSMIEFVHEILSKMDKMLSNDFEIIGATI